MRKAFSNLWSRFTARTTLFAAWFAVTSFLLERSGHLSGNYVAMCTAVQTLIVAHSIKEDHYARKHDEDNGDSQCQ